MFMSKWMNVMNKWMNIRGQWRIQDLAQGGDKSGAKRPKNFLSPPWAPQGGDRGGTVPPLKLHSPKILHHLLNEFTRKYQEKNLCPPPESLRGGTFWLSPPWIAQAGDNSQGGDSPPPEIAQGGDSPLVPPLYPLLLAYVSLWFKGGQMSGCFSTPFSSTFFCKFPRRGYECSASVKHPW